MEIWNTSSKFLSQTNKRHILHDSYEQYLKDALNNNNVQFISP